MEVQAHYMMTKGNMKFLTISLALSFCITPIFAKTLKIEEDSLKYWECNSRGEDAYEKKLYDVAYSYYIRVVNDPQSKGYSLGNSLFKIGVLFANGNYLKQNIDSALVYLRKALNIEDYNGYKSARFISHLYYFESYGCPNKEESLKWLKYAASLGCNKSNYELGELYEYGRTFMCQDTTIVLGYSEDGKACYITTKFVKNNINLYYPSINKDLFEAYKYYENSLDYNYCYYEAECKITYYEIAKSYMDGVILDKDLAKAFNYLLDAIHQQDDYDYTDEQMADIYWRLQGFYRFGYKTRPNPTKANELLCKSAEYGHPLASIALIYLGLVTP